MYFYIFVPGKCYVLLHVFARFAQCIVVGHWDSLCALHVQHQSLGESGFRASSNLYHLIAHGHFSTMLRCRDRGSYCAYLQGLIMIVYNRLMYNSCSNPLSIMEEVN